MKKFLVLFLIYSLNILVFLFAKSAGAETFSVIARAPAIETISRPVSILRLPGDHRRY